MYEKVARLSSALRSHSVDISGSIGDFFFTLKLCCFPTSGANTAIYRAYVVQQLQQQQNIKNVKSII